MLQDASCEAIRPGSGLRIFAEPIAIGQGSMLLDLPMAVLDSSRVPGVLRQGAVPRILSCASPGIWRTASSSRCVIWTSTSGAGRPGTCPIPGNIGTGTHEKWQ